MNPDGRQGAKNYLLAVLAFSLASLVVLFLILVFQDRLPFNRDLPGMGWAMALNTAVSFVTNTNWQSYAGESTLGFTAQMSGLAVQNFVSAAVGIAVAAALIRALMARSSDDVGNFWVDLVRINLRLLLPLSIIAAVVLMAGGVVQSFADVSSVGVAGQAQTVPGGPVAGQEAIKLLGTNGGGFFNANSAHPYENPTPWTNLFETFLLLVIPFSLTRTFATMTGNRRQGRGPARRDGAALGGIGGGDGLGRGRPLRTVGAGGRCRHGGQGDPVRRLGLGDLRRQHHRDLDRRGQRLARLDDPDGRRGAHDQHDAR